MDGPTVDVFGDGYDDYDQEYNDEEDYEDIDLHENSEENFINDDYVDQGSLLKGIDKKLLGEREYLVLIFLTCSLHQKNKITNL